MTDTRYVADDPCVYEPFNFGILINGEVNPVEWALIQLNGHDRFDRREGAYFNYVQPDQHHTNTPADGINVYSFAIHPEQHQPSGTCNLSRIDNTQLNIWFKDSTFVTGLPNLFLFNNDNQLYIFDFNYNVLILVRNSCTDYIRQLVIDINSIATLSNCDDFLILLILNISKNLIIWINTQPNPLMDAVQRLYDSGWSCLFSKIYLRDSLLLICNNKVSGKNYVRNGRTCLFQLKCNLLPKYFILFNIYKKSKWYLSNTILNKLIINFCNLCIDSSFRLRFFFIFSLLFYIILFILLFLLI